MSDTSLHYKGDMADVEALCGREVADHLSELLSGIYLYVPIQLSDDTSSPLNKLELDHAEAVMREFGGSLIYVSRPRRRYPTQEEVGAELAKGRTPIQIAVLFQISDRWVRILAKRHEAKPAKAGRPTPKLLPPPDPASGPDQSKVKLLPPPDPAPGPDTKSNAGLTHPTGAGGPRQSPTTPKPKTPASGPLRASQRHES